MSLDHLFTDLTASSNSTEFVGIPMEDVSGITRTRDLLDKCVGCPLAVSEHKCFKRILYGPDNNRKALQLDSITRYNEEMEILRKLQRYIQLLHLTAHGVLVTQNQLAVAENVSDTVSYNLVSISGNTITVELGVDDEDPLRIGWVQASLNPNYGSEGEARLSIINTFHCLPTNAIVTFSAPSLLRDHAGFIVRKYNLSQTSYAENDTFSIELESAATGADSLFPTDSTDQIRVNITYYSSAYEPWLEPRNITPLWVIQDEITELEENWITYYDNVLVPIGDFKIRDPNGDNRWFKAYKRTAVSPEEIWSDITFAAIGNVYIDNGPTSSVNIPMDELLDADAIKIQFWKEDTSSTYAVNGGCDRCIYSVPVYDNSYGTTDGSIRWMCSQGEDASGFANYIPACYQTGCDKFTLPVATDFPSKSEILNQIRTAHPWRAIQKAVGSTDFYLDRFGSPSLASLTGVLRGGDWDVPLGQHSAIYFQDTAGWCWMGETADVVWQMVGLEQQKTNADVVEIATSGTWGAIGPAANNPGNISEYLDALSAVYDADNDPHSVFRSQMFSGSSDISMYSGQQVNDWSNYYQRFADVLVYCPKLDLSSNVQYRDGCKFQRKYYDANFNPVETLEEATYHAVLELTDHLSANKTNPTRDWGGLLSFREDLNIWEASYSGSTLSIEPENWIVESSTQSGLLEWYCRWKRGGLTVPTNEALRVRNYYSWDGVVGPQLDKPGVPGRIIEFPNSEGFEGPISEHKFYIKKAVPFGGTSGDQDIIPADENSNGNIIYGRGSYRIPFNSLTEAAYDVDILRDDVWLGDNLIILTALDSSEIKPYPLNTNDDPIHIPKDRFYWRNYTTEIESGVEIFFSQYNVTTTSVDYIMYISVTTDADTYVENAVNLKDYYDAYLPISVVTTYEPLEITDVQVTSELLDEDGSQHVFTLTPTTTYPTNYAQMEASTYYVTLGALGYEIIIPALWAGDSIKVSYRGNIPADQMQWWDDNVAIQQYKPSDERDYAQVGDLWEIQDENNVIANYVSGGGTFVDRKINVYCNGRAAISTPIVWISTYGDESAPSALDTSEYNFFAASGKLYIKKTTTIPENGCITLQCYLADRNSWNQAEDLNHVKNTIESIIQN